MSALSPTNTTLLNADGSSDPAVGFNGITLTREIDFGVTAVVASTNYEFFGIPKGFVMLAIGVAELEKCPSGTITVKNKGDSTTLGGSSVTVGGDTLAEAALVASKAFATGDTLCIVPSVNMGAGRVRVSITGVLPNGDTRYSPELAAPWRKIGNTQRNVAEPDRLLGK